MFEIVKNRDLSKAQVFLDLFGTNSVNKALLLQLPEVDKLKLNWCAKVTGIF